jgi:hypothetical protein
MTITQARSRAAKTAFARGDDVGDGTRSAASQARTAFEGAPEHLSEAVDAAVAAAKGTTATLQTMEDATLGLLAAASIGLAGGFHLTGARRVLTVVAIAPALAAGLAILTRPGRSRLPH